MNKVIIATLIATAAILSGATPARAEVVGEQSQEQKFEQELKIECENGSGQSGRCYATGKQSGEQSQRQRILAQNNTTRNVKIHTPVNTAMDLQAVSLIVAAAMIGLGSAALLTKTV